VSLGRECADVISALTTLWFVGLGMAIMLRVPGGYIRQSVRCLVWPLALIVKTTKRLLETLAHTAVSWISYHLRHW